MSVKSWRNSWKRSASKNKANNWAPKSQLGFTTREWEREIAFFKECLLYHKSHLMHGTAKNKTKEQYIVYIYITQKKYWKKSSQPISYQLHPIFSTAEFLYVMLQAGKKVGLRTYIEWSSNRLNLRFKFGFFCQGSEEVEHKLFKRVCLLANLWLNYVCCFKLGDLGCSK